MKFETNPPCRRRRMILQTGLAAFGGWQLSSLGVGAKSLPAGIAGEQNSIAVGCAKEAVPCAPLVGKWSEASLLRLSDALHTSMRRDFDDWLRTMRTIEMTGQASQSIPEERPTSRFLTEKTDGLPSSEEKESLMKLWARCRTGLVTGRPKALAKRTYARKAL